jgi:hypothetical protein
LPSLLQTPQLYPGGVQRAGADRHDVGLKPLPNDPNRVFARFEVRKNGIIFMIIQEKVLTLNNYLP